MKKKIVLATLSLFLLAGCNQPGLVEDNSYTRTKTGAALGAITGAVVGYNAKGKNRRTNAIIGGVLGAAAGGAIGYSLDNQANEVAKALGTGVSKDPLRNANDIVVSKTPNYVQIMFRDRMMFATGSATLQSTARYKVNQLARVLAKYPKTVVGVAGFTDNVGSYNYNQDLSERRAISVANLLSANGTPSIKGCSYNKPLVPNTNARNKALNRRVEVYLYPDRNRMINPCN